MTSSNRGQYLRLRNLSGPRAVEEDISGYDEEEELSVKDSTRIGDRKARTIGICLLLSLLINVVCLWKIARSGLREKILTYSPAESEIENEAVVFSSAFGVERSAFQGGPSEANNKLWADLYDFGISRITAAEAKPMANKTLPLPDKKGGYIVQLAVFHQLHCLNMIRKGLYGDVDWTNRDGHNGIEHLDHCVDMLRQSIMCNSDLTPTTFTRQRAGEPMKVVAEVVHSCRSFAKIQQWAWNRRITETFDKSKIVTNDPLGWGTYTWSP